MSSPDFKVLFEDTHLVVLDKPAGLLSQGGDLGGRQGGASEPNLVDLLRVHFGRNYVGLIHRLDRNTSGLMVVAKRTKSAQRLTDSLKNGTLKRSYLAILTGWVAEKQGIWTDTLLKNPKTNEVTVVKKGTPESKEAQLNFECLKNFEFKKQKLSLMRFVLETGRSHQIRVQAQARGYPLLGDPKYGAATGEGPKLNRLALHSAGLEFPHPMSAQLLTFDCPLPEELAVMTSKS